MTNCMRCQGLLVWDYDEALRAMNLRCVCCAFRPLDPPPRAPEPHHLSKVATLTRCRCGNEKVEWRMQCTACNVRKQEKEQRRREKRKLAEKARKAGAHADK